jgi:hypothetical protein
MFNRRLLVILALTSAGGGLLLTLISGLYTVKPFILDAEIVHFGFPLAWFEATRNGLLMMGPWHYYFLWQSFTIDFLLYGLLIAAAIWVYFMFLPKKQRNTDDTFMHK